MLLLVLLGTASQRPSSELLRGAGFAGGPMATPHAPLGGAAANTSMRALAATGAAHVQLYSTWYHGPCVSTACAVQPYPGPSASPLRSETDAELRGAMAMAGELKMQVILSPRLDLNWDAPELQDAAPYNTSIADIGLARAPGGWTPDGWSPQRWSEWFGSYSLFILHHARLCGGSPACTGLVLGNGLTSAFRHVTAAEWRALAAKARAALPAEALLLVISSKPEEIDWWDAVDRIGFSALHTPLARFNYTQASGVIREGISVPWPPLAFGKPLKQGQATWGTNLTEEQCFEACSGATSHAGPCTAVNYDPKTTQCYLYTRVAEREPQAGTWRSYDQQLVAGASSCHDTAGLVSAWESDASMAALAALAARHKKSVVLSFGYQSRPDAHRAPAGALRPGRTDCSVWNRCYDEVCQASLAQAALTAFGTKQFFGGALWSYWSTDPTQGGISDSSRSPRGKTTEGVLRRFFGADSPEVPPVSALAEEYADAVSVASEGARGGPAPAGARNGYVFGTGEWSAANLTLADAKRSLDSMVAAGANAVGEFRSSRPPLSSHTLSVEVFGPDARHRCRGAEFMVTWYAKDGVESTAFYPANASSPLATLSDADLTALFRYSKHRHNLTVAFTPFLDPMCNDPKRCSAAEMFNWRGTLCTAFNESQFEEFFSHYTPLIVRYAKLAQASGAVDEYFISHELMTCVKPPHLPLRVCVYR